MKEIYWNTNRDMLLVEDLKEGSVTRISEMPRSFFIAIDHKIKELYPDQHAELCTLVGGVGCEYGRVYQFLACNFSTKDGNPDIDDDLNFKFERVACPIRHNCKMTICKAQITGKISEREIEVINFFIKGFSEEQIGERLFISKSTVHNHITHIYTKLGLTGTPNPDRQLIVYVMQNKLVKF